MLQDDISSTSTTAGPTAADQTTTKQSLSLFTFRTAETTTTTTTTTPKPKSLQELLERSHGKRDKLEEVSSTVSTSTTTEQTRKSFRNQLASSLRAKLKAAKNKQDKETNEQKEHIEAGKKVPETNRISESYQDRFKLKDIPIKNDDVSKILPKDYPLSSSSTFSNKDNNGGALLQELLSSIKDFDKLKKDLTTDSSLPSSSSSSPSSTSKSTSSNRFTPRAPPRDFSKGYKKPSETSSPVFDDISALLPADYTPATTEKPKLSINNLFDNIESEDIPADLLPKDFKPKFKPKIKQEEISLDLLPKDYPKSNLKIEQAPASFLPKDYKKPKIVQDDISSLLPKDFTFKTETINPSLLPPGYDPNKFKDDSSEASKDDDPLAGLLPKDYKLPTSKEEPTVITDSSLLPKDFKFNDIDPKFLPKDYKFEEKEASEPKQDDKKLIKFNFW